MIKLTISILAFSMIALIVTLIRKKTLAEKYALTWLVMAVLILIGTTFSNKINELSKILGFQYLSNFILLVFGIINLIIIMQLSVILGKVEDQNQELAAEIALIKDKFSDRPTDTPN